jgi:general stress protein YciG
MAGTKEGAAKMRATMIAKHGEDFWKNIGAKGGKRSTETGGFKDIELAKRAGRIGGAAPRKRKNEQDDIQ